MSPDFSIEIEAAQKEHARIVHLEGELDEISMDKLQAEIEPILQDMQVHEVIFNLEKLRFINSKGIGYLVSVQTHLTKDGKSMVLCAASDPVMDVITLVGLTSIISYYPTLEEALSN